MGIGKKTGIKGLFKFPMIDMFAKSNKKQSSVKPAESEWLGVGWDLGDTHLICCHLNIYEKGERERERRGEKLA